MVIKSINPWSKAGGLEPQRSDLWVANLEPAVKALSAIEQFQGITLPERGTSRYYARQVIFPDVGISEYESKTHSIPKTYPGYDEQLGNVRMDFLVDAGHTKSTDGTLLPQVNSRLYNLIRLWHQVARVGRPTRSVREDSIAIPLQAVPTSYANFFRFDIQILLYSGTDFDNSQYPTEGGVNVEGLSVTSNLVLRRCWVKAYQLGNLDHETNGMFKLTVSFAPESISPYDETKFGKATPS